jgi:chaperone required for assembly of F1-ATPase
MKRFYKSADIAPEGRLWRVTLDGRPIRTQGGRAQLVPSAALATAMAREWADQPAEIDAGAFGLRDLADFAIDVVAPDPADTIRGVVGFAGTDTLCYRDEPGSALWRRQEALWEPLLAAAEACHGCRMTRVVGVMHRPQRPEALARLETCVAAHDAFALAALNTAVSLSASLVIGLAALAPDADLENLWAAANLEEDWQAEVWGQDAEALIRRGRRRESFLAAARFAALARAD